MPPKYQALFFDLDDTLLDTSGSLIQQALERAHRSLNEHLSMEFAHFLQKYRAHQVSAPRVDFFSTLSQNTEANLAARQAFYSYRLIPPMKLMEGAMELLDSLRAYPLYLVTAGNPDTQRQKIDLSGIGDYFRECLFVDGKAFAHKGDAFRRLIETNALSPQRILCIGNRADHEIAEGKRLGCDTCLVKYGEYLHLKPQNAYEQPDYEIRHLSELIATCRL